MEPESSSEGTSAVPLWIYDGADYGPSPLLVTYVNWSLLQEIMDSQLQSQY